ncbi:MAG: hypothetical protein M3345_07305 [Actinomycetota bacterium]|nr:hypothetical protein [Actinomycetota bacterium]
MLISSVEIIAGLILTLVMTFFLVKDGDRFSAGVLGSRCVPCSPDRGGGRGGGGYLRRLDP